MEIPKEQILSLLRERGEGDKAAEAEQELPEQVDTDRDSGLLARFGVDPQDFLGDLPGGLGDRLGGL